MIYLHVFEAKDADRVLRRLGQLIQELGLPINGDKVVEPGR